VEDDSLLLGQPVTLVDMPEDMQLGPDLHHLLQQTFASCVLFRKVEVQNSVGWAMGDQDVHIIGNGRPQLVSLSFFIHEPPFAELRCVGRPKNSESFDLHSLMLEVGAAFL
jgi:hypothetical protein